MIGNLKYTWDCKNTCDWDMVGTKINMMSCRRHATTSKATGEREGH